MGEAKVRVSMHDCVGKVWYAKRKGGGEGKGRLGKETLVQLLPGVTLNKLTKTTTYKR